MGVYLSIMRRQAVIARAGKMSHLCVIRVSLTSFPHSLDVVSQTCFSLWHTRRSAWQCFGAACGRRRLCCIPAPFGSSLAQRDFNGDEASIRHCYTPTRDDYVADYGRA